MSGPVPPGAAGRPTPRWTDRRNAERRSPDRRGRDSPDADPRDPAHSGSRFVRLYRARPWHLLTLLVLFVVTAYVASRLLMNPSWLRITIWFVGAAVVWDLVLGPLYALADRLLRGALPAGRGARVPLLNHVRAPALASTLLLLMFTPLIFERSEQIFRLKAGLPQDPYLLRWLLVTGVLFLFSALVYGLRVAQARRQGGSRSV